MKKEKVFSVTANYESFDKEGGGMIMWNCEQKVDAWKMAFYELWRYQMTWHFCHRLEVIDGSNGLFVHMICKESFTEPLLNTMEGIGYRNIQKHETYVGVVDCMKVPDDVEEIIIGW